MSEIFDIIIAVNRLKDQVKELVNRIDFICKYPSVISSDKMVDEKVAKRMLHCGRSTLYAMCLNGDIAFCVHHRKRLYYVDSINDYLAKNSQPVRDST